MKKQNRLTTLFASVVMVASSLAMVACGNPAATSPAPTATTISSVTNERVYFPGDTVEKADFTVKIRSGSTRTLRENEFTIDIPSSNLEEDGTLKFSENKEEHQEEISVKIKYNNLSKTGYIVLKDAPKAITVTKKAGAPEFLYVGEEINISWYTVEATYDGDANPVEVTEGLAIKGGTTVTAETTDFVVTYGSLESGNISVTVKEYDGGLVTSATATASDTTDDGVTGNLYRGFQFTNNDTYIPDQWAVQTNIVTDADLEADKYYKISFVLGSTVDNQSTIVNVCSDGEQFYSKKFTTNATNNQIELKIAPTEAVENVGIDIGHGWTPNKSTFTIKNLKIEEVDISAATEMTLTASEDSFGSTATTTFTATVMGFDVRPVYAVKSETASSGSSVEEDGTFVFGTFNEGKTESAVTVKATFNGIEAEKTVTVKMLSAFDDTVYTWSDDVAASATWTYETTNKNIGIYSSIGATAQFSTDGTAVKYRNTDPDNGWNSEWNTQVAIGAFDVAAGDTYRISFKTFFANTDGNINDGSSDALVPSFTDVKEYSKDVVAKPNQYKDNKAEAVIAFGMGYVGVTNTVTIYDVKVEKIASYTVTGIAITPATTSTDTLKKGKTQQFVAKDTGTLGAERTVEWSVTPSTAGTITDAGKFTAGEVAEDTVVTITAKYSETISATTQITVLAPSGTDGVYTITAESIVGAGGEFIFNWSDDAYALPISTDAIVTFQFGDNVKENQPWARAEGDGLRAYMSTVGAAWSNAGAKAFYVRVKATSGKMYDINGTITVNGATAEISDLEISIVENITPSETKVSFDSASADAVEVTMTSEGFTASSYSVTSSNTDVATVSVSGNKVTITPAGDGDAVVTVTADGKTAEIKVHVGAVANLATGFSVYNYLDSANSTVDIISISGNNVTINKPAATGWGHPWSSQLFLELTGANGELLEQGKSYRITFTVTSSINIDAGCVVKLSEKNTETQKDGALIKDAGTFAYPANTPVAVEMEFTAGKSVSNPIIVMALGGCDASTIVISDIVITSN